MYIEGQRSIARARTPVTPTYPGHHIQPPPEDLLRLDQLVHALQDLRLRLSNHQDLVVKVDHLLEYLRNLRQDFPLQAPEEAFERLQSFRALLLWLPPLLFRPNESDAGAIAMLAYVYAAALALEPLFPEIGGSYLGTLAVTPLEKLHSILISRRAAQPQDTSTQVALSLLDVPMQVLSSYRSRQRHLAHSIDAYRHSPLIPVSVSPHQLVSRPEITNTALYSHSPDSTPGSLQVPPMSSYFQGASIPNIHRHSSSSYSSQHARSPMSPQSAPLPTYPAQHAMSGVGMGISHSLSLPSEPMGYPLSYGLDSRFVNPFEVLV